MAKKKSQSLTERIAALINRVGEKPEPTFGDIKSELVECLGLAETLQDGAAIRDAEAKAAVLETENSNLKIALKALKTEVEAFRADRKKQQEEERKRDIPPKQFEILRRLPSKHGGLGLTVPQIWREVNGRLDEIEIHVDKLEKAGLIAWHMEADGEKFWRRTMPGNELVVAKRLAGEAEEKEPRRKHADRTEIEGDVMKALAMLGPMDCHDFATNTRISADRAEVALYDLEKDGFAKMVNPAETGIEAKYDLSIEGVRYLLERKFLD